MSDIQLDPEQQAAAREALEDQANLLGIEFRASISDAKLKERVSQVLKGSQDNDNTDDGLNKQTKPVNTDLADVKLIPQGEMKFSKEITNQEKHNAARQQVRVTIVCNDPAKKEWQGEVLEVGNSVIGEIRKYIPYGTPWYVPQALINMIESKQYQRFYTRKDKFGNETRYGRNEKAFSVSYIGNLKPEELAALAKKQMARGDID